MSKVKKETDKTVSKPQPFLISEEEYAIEFLLQNYTSKQKPSENILVVIQHLEAIQRLLIKEVNEIDVLDYTDV